ncbi:MAG: diacylglycerol kinase family lipid kinase [Bacteroidales bacterium]|nr:diacylglycerol kinase family lipid kinase [Bacteroidales bacterium]
MGETKKKIKFIINPRSGTRDKFYIESFLIQYIDHRQISYEFCFTEYAGHGVELAKDAAMKNYDAVIAIGGDGTVNEVAKALVNSNTALGIIPNGSGNGLARYLKIPLTLKRAIDVINKFYVTEIDTATINGLFFVSIAGLGFDALVAENFAKTRIRGLYSYARIVLENFFKYKPKKYIFQIEDKTIIRNAMMVTFANSNQFGFNSVIAPTARINDGLIDLCIIKKIPFIEAPILSILLFLKRIDVSKHIEIIKTKEVVIKQSRKRVAHVDGDPVILEKDIHVKVHPLNLKVIVNPSWKGKYAVSEKE